MDTGDIRLAKDSWCLRKWFLEVGSLLALLHFSLERAEPAAACCLLSVNTKRNLKPSILFINTTQCDFFLAISLFLFLYKLHFSQCPFCFTANKLRVR